VPAPFLDGLGVGAKGLGEMVADARDRQWMRIRHRHQRQRPRIGPLLGIRRDQPGLGIYVIEIFDDRQRLEDGMPVMDEGRHHALGIHLRIFRLELLAGEDVDGNFLERQPLEPQRHAHPKRRD
jgi:hypothetical protein